MTYIPPLPNSMPLDDSATLHYKKFACHYDTITFADISTAPLSLLNATGTLDTSIKKFGAGSVLFNGGQEVRYTGSKVLIGARDFTLESWVYLTTVSIGYQGILYVGAGGADGILLIIETNNRLTAYSTVQGGGGWDFSIQQAALLTLGWHHICLERFNNVFTLYVDGVSVGSHAVVSTYAVRQGDNFFYVGKYPGLTGLVGNMDDVLFSVGQALHQGAFAVPTQPFTLLEYSSPVLGEMRQDSVGGIWLCTDANANTWKQVTAYAYPVAS